MVNGLGDLTNRDRIITKYFSFNCRLNDHTVDHLVFHLTSLELMRTYGMVKGLGELTDRSLKQEGTKWDYN